jgi:hypothetical protein
MIEPAAGPDPVTPAIARHITDSGRVVLELPDGRLTVVVHTAELGDSRDGLVNSGDRGLGGNQLSRVRFRPCPVMAQEGRHVAPYRSHRDAPGRSRSGFRGICNRGAGSHCPAAISHYPIRRPAGEHQMDLEDSPGVELELRTQIERRLGQAAERRAGRSCSVL